MRQNKHQIVTKKGKILLPLLISGFILANVFITIFVTADGTKLSSLEKELNLAKVNQRILMSQLVDNSSLTEIRKDVDTEGFVEPAEVVYLTTDQSVAKLPDSF